MTRLLPLLLLLPLSASAATAPDVGTLELHGSIIPRATFRHDQDATFPDFGNFSLARATIVLAGRLEKAPIRFLIEGNYAQEREAAAQPEYPITYAYVEWMPVKEYLALQLGAFKVPFSRHYLTTHTRLAFPDYAHPISVLSLDYGYQLGALATGGVAGERVVFWLSATNGDLPGKLGIFPTRAPNAGNADESLLGVARVDVNVLGTKDFRRNAYTEAAPDPDMPALLAIGLNGGFENLGSEDAKVNVTRVGADALFRLRGASVQAELLREEVKTQSFSGDQLGRRWGAFGQVGYNLSAAVAGLPLEPVARWEVSRELLVPIDTEYRRQSFAGGLNWYFTGHDAKLQTDLTWNQRRDSPDEEPASRFRLQLVVRL